MNCLVKDKLVRCRYENLDSFLSFPGIRLTIFNRLLLEGIGLKLRSCLLWIPCVVFFVHFFQVESVQVCPRRLQQRSCPSKGSSIFWPSFSCWQQHHRFFDDWKDFWVNCTEHVGMSCWKQSRCMDWGLAKNATWRAGTKNSILESEQYRAVGGAQSHTKILALIRTNEGPKQSIDAANIASDNPTTDLVFTWALPL